MFNYTSLQEGGNRYLSFWNKVGTVDLIECSDKNSTAYKYPHCSRKPSALPPQDTNLVAAGHLSNWDSCNQWQMCLSATAMDPSAVCTCCFAEARVEVSIQNSKGKSTAKLRKWFFLMICFCFSFFFHLKGQGADGIITHGQHQPIILSQ